MSVAPLVQCVYVTEDRVREWSGGNANPSLNLSQPVPMLRFLYELSSTMARSFSPLQFFNFGDA